MKKSLYDILELSRTASVDSIQAAYARLSAAAQSQVDAGDADAKLRLIAIREAYATLSDPARKSLYDLRLAATATPAPEPEMIEVPEERSGRARLAVLAGGAAVLLLLVFGSIRLYTSHQVELERERLQKIEALVKQKLELERQQLEAQRESESRRAEFSQQSTQRNFSRQDQMDEERRRRQQESERLQFERQRQMEKQNADRQQQADQQRRQREEQIARDRERFEAERRFRADKDLLRQTCLQRYGRPDC